MSSTTKYLNVQLTDETDKQVWQAAERAVAESLGVDVDELTRPQVARELAEAYTGGDANGRWQDGSRR